MSQQVLHLDLFSLIPAATVEQREHLISEAGTLASLNQVVAAGIIESQAEADFGVAFFYVLPDFNALEPFGTQPRYSRFLQGTVAPLLQGLAGADVSLDAAFPEVQPYAACLALSAPDQAYDWEIRQTLHAWADDLSPRVRAVGLAVGERQRYRGLVLAFGPQLLEAQKLEKRPFAASLICGKARLLP